MIIGFPYQDEAAMLQEFEELMELESGDGAVSDLLRLPRVRRFTSRSIKEQRYHERYRQGA